MSKPEIGDWRYFVEYLDYAKGAAIMRKEGGDPEKDGLWDFVEQDEITERKPFPTKSRAVAWAQKNKKLDVFNMPRIVEETYQQAHWDDTGEPIPGQRYWEQTGYWETDGQTEIGEST